MKKQQLRAVKECLQTPRDDGRGGIQARPLTPEAALPTAPVSPSGPFPAIALGPPLCAGCWLCLLTPLNHMKSAFFLDMHKACSFIFNSDLCLK